MVKIELKDLTGNLNKFQTRYVETWSYVELAIEALYLEYDFEDWDRDLVSQLAISTVLRTLLDPNPDEIQFSNQGVFDYMLDAGDAVDDMVVFITEDTIND